MIIREKKKRILSIFLALIICFGILPTVAFAAETPTADDSVDTSTTQVIGYLKVDKATYEATSSINGDSAWTTNDGGLTYTKTVYNSGKQDVEYTNPCTTYIEGFLDSATTAVNDAGGDYVAAQPELSYSAPNKSYDECYRDKVTDNRKYEWIDAGEGPYPELVESGRYIYISQDYGRERVYSITGVLKHTAIGTEDDNNQNDSDSNSETKAKTASEKSPDTSDNSKLTLAMMLLITSAIAVMIAALYSRKRKQNQ